VRSVLITGAAGQDGILLAELLHHEGYDVWALVRPGSRGIAELTRRVPDVRLLLGDVQDRVCLREAIGAAQPAEIYNLAAISSVGRSWELVEQVMAVNAMGAMNVLEELRGFAVTSGGSPRFYQASSSEMFGLVAESPQREGTPFHPRSPYGVSKSAAHFLTVNYRESYGLFACSGILYNHESPLREPHFVTRKITQGVAAIERGLSDHIELGTLDVSRDWGYAPDYVRAMWLMLQQDEPDDYIVASGQQRTLEEFLATAFRCIGVDDWRPYIKVDDTLKRPAEVRGLVGDASKARSRLGWAPSVGFEEMISIMVEHDRSTADAGRRIDG
jgi:GDPmannose 4,6-dehydratase